MPALMLMTQQLPSIRAYALQRWLLHSQHGCLPISTPSVVLSCFKL
jgi:hypothetical protein